MFATFYANSSVVSIYKVLNLAIQFDNVKFEINVQLFSLEEVLSQTTMEGFTY